MKLFAIEPKERHHNDAQATSFWGKLKPHRKLFVPTSSMLAYYSGAFGDGGQPFSQLYRKTAIMELMMMSFVCFIWTAEFGVLELFQPSGIGALQDEGCLYANEEVLVPLSRKIKVKIM